MCGMVTTEATVVSGGTGVLELDAFLGSYALAAPWLATEATYEEVSFSPLRYGTLVEGGGFTGLEYFSVLLPWFCMVLHVG